MPVKSSSSSVLRWPEHGAVLAAARGWASVQRAARKDGVRVGVFGSYARGDAGVGSDLDLVAIVQESSTPFARRAAGWDITPLPVPAEILIYTEAEWQALQRAGGRFARMLLNEVLWLE